MPPIISFQREIQAEMINQSDKLHVILEHFSFDLQHLLDRYMDGEINFEQLVDKYHITGEEGHNLEPYRELFQDAKNQQGGIHLHAGFLPRKYARMLMREGEKSALDAAKERKWIPDNTNLDSASDFHYNVFESLLSGRSIYNSNSNSNSKSVSGDDSSSSSSSSDNDEEIFNDSSTSLPSDQFRNIFKAQILKDEAMAHRVTRLIQNNNNNSEENEEDNEDVVDNEKFLVIAGNGHLLHYCGVPERVLRENPEMAADTCLVISEDTTSNKLMGSGKQCCPHDDSDNNSKDGNIAAFLRSRFGREGSNPADYMYLYEVPKDILDEWKVKEETTNTYNKVGDTANIPGNSLKAAWIMHSMGYTEEDFEAAGPDVYNFQGVGNPHLNAKIQKGDIVLDIGSGCGVDATIACNATGPEGLVVGIDVSESEVRYALKKTREQGLNAHFLVADVENLSGRIPSNSVDVIISNGAFCLVPNKKRAFRELYRVLKPGGRISICTTTIAQEDDLDDETSWPICMKMFVSKNELKPMCEKLGFVDVIIDDSDSTMTMEIPDEIIEEDDDDESNSSASSLRRSKVHDGNSDFDHLDDYDMDSICERVCIVGRKPLLINNSSTKRYEIMQKNRPQGKE